MRRQIRHMQRPWALTASCSIMGAHPLPLRRRLPVTFRSLDLGSRFHGDWRHREAGRGADRRTCLGAAALGQGRGPNSGRQWESREAASERMAVPWIGGGPRRL